MTQVACIGQAACATMPARFENTRGHADMNDNDDIAPADMYTLDNDDIAEIIAQVADRFGMGIDQVKEIAGDLTADIERANKDAFPFHRLRTFIAGYVDDVLTESAAAARDDESRYGRDYE